MAILLLSLSCKTTRSDLTQLSTASTSYALETKLLDGEAFGVNIFHLNDTHSNFEPTATSLVLQGQKVYVDMGGYVNLAALLTELRRELPPEMPSLLLQAGDAFQGSLYFTQNKGTVSAVMMNEMKFDAMTVGNHEFDLGSEALSQFARETHFPVLGANIDVTQDPLLDKVIKPYTIKTFGAEKIGIIGLTTASTAALSSPSRETKFRDEASAAEQYIKELQQKGVNKIILLTHMGYEPERRLAAKVEGAGVIIGGHTHTLLGDVSEYGLTSKGSYPTLEKSSQGKQVCIGQAWEKSYAVGQMLVFFDKDGNVMRCVGRPVIALGKNIKFKDSDSQKKPITRERFDELDHYVKSTSQVRIVEGDVKIQELLKPYSDGVNALGLKQLTTLRQDLLHIRLPGVHTSGARLDSGSQIAPLMATAMKWKANSAGGRVQLGLINAGSLRNDIPAGPLTVKNVYELLPFNNTLVIMELPLENLRQSMEQAAETEGGFPYLVGMRYRIDMNEPKGRRLSFVTTKKGQELVRIVLPSYLFTGGDGYRFEGVVSAVDTGFVDNESFMEYSERHGLAALPASDLEYVPAKK
jgi:5'-nucleotidase